MPGKLGAVPAHLGPLGKKLACLRKAEPKRSEKRAFLAALLARQKPRKRPKLLASGDPQAMVEVAEEQLGGIAVG